MENYHPLRSVLYMPASNERALVKARSLPADGVILDLEDAVAPDCKIDARQQLAEHLQQGGFGGRTVIVRVNGLDTEWGADDIAQLGPLAPDAILLPKVNSCQQVNDAIHTMTEAKTPLKTAFWAMIETPQGVQNINTISQSNPRLQALVMGTSDLAKELQVPHTPDRLGFLYALSRCVIAARAQNLAILDGVFLDLTDNAGFETACQQSVNLGFDGRTLIHPRQIEAANRYFSPSEAAIQQAQQIIDAWQKAQQQGQGVAVVNGKLVENLHVDQAKRLLAFAQTIAAQH